MKNLKDFIDENREGFENENLLPGHKERFLLKINKIKNETNTEDAPVRVSYNNSRLIWAAAALVILLVAIPLLVTDKSNPSQPVISYAQIIKDKGEVISKQALLLNETDQNVVMTTLNQLEFESVPFENQLPDTLTGKEKEDLIESYYKPKIEGIERLEKYVAQLTKI